MSKVCSCTRILQSVFLLTLLFSANVFGQKDALENDLKKSFGKFNVIRAGSNFAQKRDTPERLTIPTTEKTYELNLTPRDLRAARYRAENTNGLATQTLTREPVTTFKGKIAGAPDSQVRLTIEGASIEGFFIDAANRFFVEPAKNYSSLAADGDLIVYRSEDALHDEGFSCDTELVERIAESKQMVDAKAAQIAGSMKVIEIATEADYEYVLSVGSAGATNNKILGILNMVEGVYESQLGLSISVVFQHTWSSPDTLNGANGDTILSSFQTYWNANYPKTRIPRDAAHLFSAKPTVMSQGLAYVNVICKPDTTTDFAYGFSGRLPVDWGWEAGNFLVTAHEIAHNLGGNHAESTQSCSNSLMNAQLSGDTHFSFCSFSRTEITNYVSANGSCLEPRGSFAPRGDFDGDGKSDVTVFRPSNGVWYVDRSNSGFNFFSFGQSGDKLVSADYDGDGKTDAAVYRGGVWHRLKSSTNTFDSISFGLATDIPAVADFDGDGRADTTVFRPSSGTWYRQNSSNGAYSGVQFGANGDIPTAADYDGDGKADINVFRPSNGVWYRLNSRDNSFYAAHFGTSGDKAVSGDFDGDGKADIAVFRPSNGVWYILRSSDNSFYGQSFGVSTDLLTPADYDGDGKTDVSVFRAGTWYRMNSSNNSFAAVGFGTNADIPAQAF
jgi:hypothetical protein